MTTSNHLPTISLSSWLQKHIKWEIYWTLCIEKYFEPALALSSKTATKHKHELSTNIEMQNKPLIELSSFTEDIHVKAQK